MQRDQSISPAETQKSSPSLTSVRPLNFWTDRSDAPADRPPLTGPERADLVIVGGGYSGLWAALLALEEAPDRSVIVLEAERCGFGASSRNGGFMAASLTHGLAQGLDLWPDEMDQLVRLGRDNLDEIESTLRCEKISAGFERTGAIDLATEEWQLDEVRESADLHRSVNLPVEVLDAEASRRLVASPTYLGGLLRPELTALVDPARLVWGLRDAVERRGGRVFDGSRVESIDAEGTVLVVSTARGRVTADRVIAATNAYTGPVRRTKRYIIPVYDHALMTEPLSAAQMAEIGWTGRQGLGDLANRFHYYRLTDDNRILWGGYDATYHFNNGVRPVHDIQDATHQKLVGQFFETFPQLEGLQFTHRWGGPIATTSRFTATWGQQYDGRLAWVGGYTGLGVGASRFGARVALDLVDGKETERTQLRMVREKPFPFPPEPIRSATVAITKRAIERADDRQGQRGMWLRLLDRFGIGFNS